MTEDGSIVINTKIRTDGVKAGAQEIEAGLRRAADRVDNLGVSAKNAINKQIDAFAKLNNEYSAQEQKVESLRQKVASYANQRIPTTEYKEISDQISKAEAIGSFLERLYTNIILPMLTWLIESGLPALINVLAGLFNFLGEHQWIVDAIGTALVTAFATSKIVPLIATISSAVLGFAGHIGTLIDILKGGGGLVGAISSLVTTFGIVPIAIAAAVAAIILIATHWDQLKTTMSNLMNWIKSGFNTDWHAQFGIFGDVVEVFLDSFNGIFNSIKQIFSGFISFFKLVFTGQFKVAGKELLNILQAGANMIYSIFKAPVNMVIALFNGLNQAIINAINGLVDGLNHIKVPDWVPGIGGKGINLSHANYTRIPYLAQGAVIPAGNPFLAVLGDQTKGNNLEMPENLLRKIVSEESGKGTGMIKLVVNLDSRTVLEQLINTAKDMQMSNGQNVFELGR